MLFCFVFSLLVFHENEVENTVDGCVDEVGETEIEYEEVCGCSHPAVPWRVIKLQLITSNHKWEVTWHKYYMCNWTHTKISSCDAEILSRLL